MNLRIAKVSDLISLRELAEQTFRDSYQDKNDPENFENYVEKTFNEAQILSELQDDSVTYFVLESNQELTGFAMVRRNSMPPEVLADNPVLELHRIYVHPAHKGKGIGKKLMLHCEKTALDEGKEFLWLGVWKENPEGLAFYRHMGYEIIGVHEFVLGTEHQEDWVMGKKLGY